MDAGAPRGLLPNCLPGQLLHESEAAVELSASYGSCCHIRFQKKERPGPSVSCCEPVPAAWLAQLCVAVYHIACSGTHFPWGLPPCLCAHQPCTCPLLRLLLLYPPLQVYKTPSALHAGSINGIAFGPQELGLVLACASSDGSVSVVEHQQDGTWTSSKVRTAAPQHQLKHTCVHLPCMGVPGQPRLLPAPAG